MSGKIFVCLMLLATANYLQAQESEEGKVNASQDDHSRHFGIPGLEEFTDLFTNFFGQRAERVETIPDDIDSDIGPQSRFFFSSFFNNRIVSCNYTTQAGSTCVGCTDVLRCLPSNAGTLKACHGFFPYCNSGRCSLFPQANCTGTG